MSDNDKPVEANKADIYEAHAFFQRWHQAASNKSWREWDGAADLAQTFARQRLNTTVPDEVVKALHSSGMALASGNKAAAKMALEDVNTALQTIKGNGQ